MTRPELTLTVRQIVADQFKVSLATITEATTFASLNGDSLDRIELLFNIEQACDLEIPDEAAADLDSVGAVVDWLFGQVGKRVAA